MRRFVQLRLAWLIGLGVLVAGCSLNPQPEPPMATSDTVPGGAGATGLGGDTRGMGGSSAFGGGAGEYSGAGGAGPADGGTLPLTADASADAAFSDAGAADGAEADGGTPDADSSGDAEPDR
jgi:hypothetical protein